MPRSRFFPFLFLLILPILYTVSSYVISQQRIGFWQGSRLDPDYAYLMDSLNVANFKSPGQRDHPGTPLSILGGGVLTVSHFLHSLRYPMANSLNESVLRNPERYLTDINIVLVGLAAFLIFCVGTISYVFFSRLNLSLILQITPWLAWAILFESTRVRPESLLFFLGQLLIVVLLTYLAKENVERSRSFLIALAVVLGLGVATKVTFIPLLILLMILPSQRERVIAAGIFIATFILATIPILNKYPQMLEWYFMVLTHVNDYGSGGWGLFSFDEFLPSAVTLFYQERVFFGIWASCSLMSLIAFLKRGDHREFKRPDDICYQKTLKLAVLMLLAIMVAILLTLKRVSGHYLVPVLGLTGFLLFLDLLLFDLHFKKMHSGLDSKLFSLIVFILCVSLGALTFSWGLFEEWKRSQDCRGEIATANQLISQKYKNCVHVSYYRTSSIPYALKFGSDTTGGSFAVLLDELYPGHYFYNIFMHNYGTYAKNVRAEDLFERGCVLVHGSPFSAEEAERCMPKELFFEDVFIGKYEKLSLAVMRGPR